MRQVKMYFANGLFNEADRDYNMKIYNRLKEEFGLRLDIYLPQLNDAINDKQAYADAQMIANADYEELENSEILLAIIDTEDAGVALEIGLAYEMGIPIVGLYTDVRQHGADNAKKIEAIGSIGQNQFSYVNLMMTGLIMNHGKLVNSIDDAVDALAVLLDKRDKMDKQLFNSEENWKSFNNVVEYDE